MANATLSRQQLVGPARYFYLAAAIGLAALVFFGFAQTYPTSLASNPGLPWPIHLHAAVFAAWVLLFVAQPALVVGGSVRLHRRLGWIGAGLACAMVVMGFVAVSAALRDNFVPDGLPRGIFVIGNLLSVLIFGGLVAAAIAKRRQPQWHKRLMICAMTLILSQALGRILPMGSIGDAAPAVLFAVVIAIALIGPLVDFVNLGRVHRAYFWGVGALLLFVVLTPVLGFSPIVPPIVRALGG